MWFIQRTQNTLCVQFPIVYLNTWIFLNSPMHITLSNFHFQISYRNFGFIVCFVEETKAIYILKNILLWGMTSKLRGINYHLGNWHLASQRLFKSWVLGLQSITWFMKAVESESSTWSPNTRLRDLHGVPCLALSSLSTASALILGKEPVYGRDLCLCVFPMPFHYAFHITKYTNIYVKIKI